MMRDWSGVKKGRRVRMTTLGRERLVMAWESRAKVRVTTGVFVGPDRSGGIRVLRDQHKTPSNYHPDFWEPRP